MLFNTYQFVFGFAPLSIAAYYLLGRLGFQRTALAATTLASLIFYAYWRVDYVPVLVGSILVNYAIGSFILASRDSVSAAAITVGCGLNLVFLGYFKYTGFLLTQANHFFLAQIQLPDVVLPLAVSFYTFQQISYLVDCYRRKIHDNDFLHYTFVVTFFPHLIAGPIVRMREISPQFVGVFTKPAVNNLCVGLVVFVIGLGKKVIVADWFGGVADPLFAATKATHDIDPVSAWIAALAYTLQLYFDFSGYSDMAIGLARMFGFRLAVNFLSPYQATSIADFWRRWHVTLSRFLRDYLYIPLGGNRKGVVRTYLNLFITMALGGLWHGANWTFVAWGAYHGILLGVHRAWRRFLPQHVQQSAIYRSLSPLALTLTFLCVVAGWVLFRSPDFATAGAMFRAIASPQMITAEAFGAHSADVYAAIAIGLLSCWCAPNSYQVLFRFRPALLLREQVALLRQRLVPYSFGFRAGEAAALSCLLLGSLYQMRGTISQFLYFMF